MAEGLDYLATVDHLLFHRNFYAYSHTVYNSGGVKVGERTREKVYTASEPTGWFAPVKRVISDGSERDVLQLHMKSPRCGPTMEVSTASGEKVGQIRQIGSRFCASRMHICHPDGAVVLVVERSGSFWADDDFIITRNEAVVGKICQQNSGDSGEGKLFGLSFPLNLSVELKALLVGAFFFLDHLHYRSSSLYFD